MIIEHWTKKYYEGSLVEALKQCCAVDELATLYTDILRPALNQPPLQKAPRKDLMIQAFDEMLHSSPYAKLFFEALQPNVRTVLGLLVWEGDLPLSELEEAAGFPISIVETIDPKTRYEAQRTQVNYAPEFSLVAFEKGDYWGYTADNPKKWIKVRLPPALRTCLRKTVPPPKGYNFEPVEKLPEGLLTYRCDETVQEDLRLVADYINHGHLQYLGTGKIRKNCMRALREMLRGGEFFSGEALPQKLELLRIDLFANLLAGADGKLRSAMLADPPDPEVFLREFLDETFKTPRFFHDLLLSHLSNSCPTGNYHDATPKQLSAIFSKLSSTGWVTFDNLRKYPYYREIPLDLFRYPSCSVTVDYKGEYGYRDSRRKIDLDVSTRQDFLTTPLLQGTAFLLAALGFAEIAYTLPTHPRWQRGGEPFLTPWDGLFALRLTPLGAYAFKQTDEVKLNATQRKRAEVFLNPNRLTVTSRNIDPVTELSLLEFMEKLSDGCYRMTRKSFLRGCSTAALVQARIEQFKANIATHPPEVWQAFLDDLGLGVVALKTQSAYKVYELTNTPELRRLFCSDSVLNEKTLKVEGLKVAIAKKDLPAVTRRLGELGYLLQ